MTIGPQERAGEPEIATTTLAEIYVQQGLLGRALAIYRRVAERSPDDARVVARVAELEAELERQTVGEAVEPGVDPPRAAVPPGVAADLDAPVLAPHPERSSGEEPVDQAGRRSPPPPVDKDREFQAWLARR
jgi:hypothetical protein